MIQCNPWIQYVTHYDPIILGMKGWFSIKKSVNLIHHINRIKFLKTHKIITTNAEKAFDKIKNYLITKNVIYIYNMIKNTVSPLHTNLQRCKHMVTNTTGENRQLSLAIKSHK